MKDNGLPRRKWISGLDKVDFSLFFSLIAGQIESVKINSFGLSSIFAYICWIHNFVESSYFSTIFGFRPGNLILYTNLLVQVLGIK